MRLADVVKELSSKNAGNFHLTYDIVFDERDAYERVKRARVITPESVADALRVEPDEVLSVIEFDPGHSFKVNVRRRHASGGPGETDVFGAQQYAPLLDLEVP